MYAHTYTHTQTHILVGVLSCIIGWKSIQWDRPAVPVALTAVLNNEVHKHEKKEDEHPDPNQFKAQAEKFFFH